MNPENDINTVVFDSVSDNDALSLDITSGSETELTTETLVYDDSALLEQLHLIDEHIQSGLWLLLVMQILIFCKSCLRGARENLRKVN